MKNLTFLLFFSFGISFTTSAQEWLPEGTELYYSYGGGLFNPITDYLKLEVKESTVLQGKECQLVEQTHGVWGSVVQHYIYKENDKLYLFHQQADSFRLQYDFSKQVNDTFFVDNYYLPEFASGADSVLSFKIANIDTFEIGTEKIKRFHLNFGRVVDDTLVFNTNGTFIFYDNIGSNQAFIYNAWSYIYDGPSSYQLRCLIDPNGVDLHFVDYACDLVPIMDLYDEVDLSVFPNPFENEIYFKGEADLFDHTVKLYDVVGKLVFQKKMRKKPDQVTQIEIPFELTQGVYILTLEDERNTLVYRKKLISE